MLGVPRTADDESVRKAYRALARELHPDVSEDPNAEERFWELTTASGVLSKPSARFLYDRSGYLSRSEGPGCGATHEGSPRSSSILLVAAICLLVCFLAL